MIRATNPADVKATCTSAELLAAIESFEQVQCVFAAITPALVRAINARRDEFEVRRVTFQVEGMWNRLLILSHVAKPSEANMDIQTLRPFAELLVKHSIRKVRLVNPKPFEAWVEVTKDGLNWRKLVNSNPPKHKAPTLGHIEGTLPPVEEVT